jgi:hypothetical protein
MKETMLHRFVSLPLAALVVSLGCGDPEVVDAGSRSDDASSGVRVELGSGTSAFETIADGAELELVSGPQGGWHVWVTARIFDEQIEGLIISYEAVPVGSTTPITMPTELQLNAMRVVREGDHWLRAGDFTVFDITGPPDVVGMQLVLTVRIRDTDGNMAEDSRTVTIVDNIDEAVPG